MPLPLLVAPSCRRHRTPDPGRRHALARAAAGLAAGGAWLAGCSPAPLQPLRIGAQPWPGYELLYLARQRGWLDPAQARLIEVPSASASLRALASHALEGAALTLDEVITARARGLRLTVVAVLNESHGADAVLGQPGLRHVRDLRGKRIGVESSAVGALMLDAMLQRQRWQVQDIRLVNLGANEHVRAFVENEVDAIVTYEPIRSRLIAAGAVPLFSSADIPGRIIDTLTVRDEWLASHGQAVRHLVASHFRGLRAWQQAPQDCAPDLAPRLGLLAREVAASYAQIILPGITANRQWLAPRNGRIHTVARQLSEVMLGAGLLTHPADLTLLASDAFLPAG